MTACVNCDHFTPAGGYQTDGRVGTCNINLPPWLWRHPEGGTPIRSYGATCDLGTQNKKTEVANG